MNNTSLAVQAVARGPMTLAQPSFDWHGWLVVINLAELIAVCVLANIHGRDNPRVVRKREIKPRRHPVAG